MCFEILTAHLTAKAKHALGLCEGANATLAAVRSTTHVTSFSSQRAKQRVRVPKCRDCLCSIKKYFHKAGGCISKTDLLVVNLWMQFQLPACSFVLSTILQLHWSNEFPTPWFCFRTKRMQSRDSSHCRGWCRGFLVDGLCCNPSVPVDEHNICHRGHSRSLYIENVANL